MSTYAQKQRYTCKNRCISTGGTVLALLTCLMGAKGPIPKEFPTNGKVLSAVEEDALTSYGRRSTKAL